jgi:UDP-N-acetyl-D-mannosaminuronate dehydrogenase
MEMPEYAVGLLTEAYGDLTGAPVLVLGAAYRGGVKETAFSGVFPTVDALRERGAVPYVSDPMYTVEELEALGLPPHRGEPVTAAIVQADHAEYRDLGPDDLPGVKALVDGRRVTDAARWKDVERIVIGGPTRLGGAER